MATIKHKGVTYRLANVKLYRAGIWRPRFEPSPKLRAAGWRGYDFKDEQGNYLATDALIKAALTQCGRVDDWRDGASVPEQAGLTISASANSFGALFDSYRASDAFQLDIKPKTQTDYNYALATIERYLGRDTLIATINRPLTIALYDKMRRNHGLSSANHHMRVFKRVMRFAMDIGLINNNPCYGLRLKASKPRVRFLEIYEIDALVTAADELGYPSIGDAIIAAEITGQRQGDILKLPITLARDLSQRVRQGKRGRIVDLPQPIIDLIRPRMVQAASRATKLTGATPQRIIIYEGTQRPYRDASSFGKVFSMVRAHAAKTAPTLLGLAPDGRPLRDDDGNNIQKAMRATFADLRDTALTRLVLSGCTISEVCAIMGHEEQTALTIWRNYLAQRPEMAQSAAEKVANWCKEQGISY